MGSFKSFEELAERVDDEGGLLRVQMVELRDVVGWSRLREGTLSQIEDQLRQHGLWCFPALSTERHAEVRVYRDGTPLAKLVKAVATPSTRGDELLREAANRDADQIVAQIRKLVCQ